MGTDMILDQSLEFLPSLADGCAGYKLRRGEHELVAVIDGHEMPLDQLSPAGATAIGPGPLPFALRRSVKVQLHGMGRRIEPIPATICAIHPALAGQSLVELSFRGADLDVARRIASLLEALRREGGVEARPTRTAIREVIVDPSRIAELCDSLARNPTRGVARAEGSPGSAIVRLLQFHRSRGLLVWETGGESVQLPATVDLIGHSSVFQIRVEEVLDESFGRITTAVPGRILRTRRRAVGRSRVSGDLLVRFRHPVWPDLTVERAVRDLSFGGLSFWGDAVEDLVYPGLELDELEVLTGGPRPIRFSAEVKLVSLTNRQGDTRGIAQGVGLQLWPRTREDRARWGRLVGDLVYPSTRATSELGQQIWDVFEASGYFRLSGKNTEGFGEHRQSFLRMGEHLERAPHLGSRMAWVSGRGVESTLSVVRAYQHSWMAHQFARRPGRPPSGSPKITLRDVALRAFEVTHLDREIRWFVAYIEANVQWLRATNIEFARRYVSQGQAFVLDFRLHEADARPGAAPPGTVGPPTEEELAALDRALAAQFPLAFREAFDLVPERFDLAGTTRLWGEMGLSRERLVRVARVGRIPVAAAVIERSEPGTNLFNMLDGVRTVFFDPAARATPEGRQARAWLLTEAAAFYAARGHRAFVLYSEPQDVPELAAVPSVRDLGDGFLWGLSASLMPDLMEHVYQLTSPRAPEI